MPKKDVPKAISTEVVRLVHAERIRRGISMNRLASGSGVSQSMISLVERELRAPTLETLLRMAGALDIDLWKLLKKATGTKKVSSD